MEKITIGPHDALILVDIQNDFISSGALPVPGGEEVIPVLNRYQKKFVTAGAPVYLTRDWHPADHCSFREQGGIWPAHCVQNTPGADFHPDLHIPEQGIIISTARNPEREAYSGFDGTGLAASLQEKGIKRVFVGGLATDYCVKATVLDGLKTGFQVFLLLDAIRGVNIKPDDTDRSIREMSEAGARTIQIADFAV